MNAPKHKGGLCASLLGLAMLVGAIVSAPAQAAPSFEDLLTQRSGNCPPVLSTNVHTGATAVPFAVR